MANCIVTKERLEQATKKLVKRERAEAKEGDLVECLLIRGNCKVYAPFLTHVASIAGNVSVLSHSMGWQCPQLRMG